MRSPSYTQITTVFLLLCAAPSWAMNSDEAGYNKMSLGFITNSADISVLAVHQEPLIELNLIHKQIEKKRWEKFDVKEREIKALNTQMRQHNRNILLHLAEIDLTLEQAAQTQRAEDITRNLKWRQRASLEFYTNGQRAAQVAIKHGFKNGVWNRFSDWNRIEETIKRGRIAEDNQSVTIENLEQKYLREGVESAEAHEDALISYNRIIQECRGISSMLKKYQPIYSNVTWNDLSQAAYTLTRNRHQAAIIGTPTISRGIQKQHRK